MLKWTLIGSPETPLQMSCRWMCNWCFLTMSPEKLFKALCYSMTQMSNTLSGEILRVKYHLLISSLAALHIPLVNTATVEERQ